METNEEKDKDCARMEYILQKEVWSLEEACLYLCISSSFMYKLTSRRKIPHYSPTGKLIYFNKSEVIEWVFRNKRQSVDDIEQQALDRLRESVPHHRRK
jgi:excisionase family DNA binding protein